MSLTVKELISRQELSEVKLVAGERGVNNQIDLTNVMDSWEIHRWLSGRELVLSNGLMLADHPEQIAALIKDLYLAGASGLLIKLNRYIHQLPGEAIAVADACGFPLLISGEQLHFSEINRILSKEANKLPVCSQRYNVFSDLLAKNAAVSAFLRTLSGFLGRDVSYYDHLTTKVLYCRSGENAAEIDADQIAGAPGKTVVRSVVANGNICGILTVYMGENDLEEDEVSSVTVDYAVNMLGIAQQKKLPSRFQDEYWREQFVGELLRGSSVVSDDEIERRGRLCGYDFFTMTRIVVVESLDRRQEAAKRAEQVLINTEHPGEGFFAVQLENHLVILWDECKLKQDCVAWCHQFCQTCKSHGLIVCAGIGEGINTTKRFRVAYHQARWAIKVGIRFSGPGVYDYSTMGVLNFLYTYTETEEAKAAVREVLGKLMDYDEKKPSYALMPTLQVIARCGFNLTNAAEELFVHYNTLKYRYMKIGEIMGIDLSEFSNQFKVQMALSLLCLCRDKDR